MALSSIHRRVRQESKAKRISTPIALVPTTSDPVPSELARLETATRVLVAPHQYDDVDEWRGQVNRALRQVSGADLAAFALPVPGRAPWLTDVAPGTSTAVLDAFDALEAGAHLGAAAQWTLRSAAEAGGARPGRWRAPAIHATIAVRIPVGADVAWHCLHFATPRAEAELARTMQLLRALLPALRAGIESWHRVELQRRTLGCVIESLADAVVLMGGDGRAAHANGAARALLEGEPDRAQLLAAAARTARGATAAEGECGAAARCEVRTRNGRYVVSAILADRLVDHARLAMVTVTAAAPAPLGDDELRARFRLTSREIEVARLLATGLTNRELAARLAISEATTRHHVERVMAKLAVNSRGKVGAMMRGE